MNNNKKTMNCVIQSHFKYFKSTPNDSLRLFAPTREFTCILDSHLVSIECCHFLAVFSLVAFGGLCAKMVVPTKYVMQRYEKALGAIYACTDSEMVHIRLAGL